MTKTKEKILKGECQPGYTYLDKDTIDGSVLSVYDAMDIYAQQEAIEFAKFTMENTFQDMNVINLKNEPDRWEYDNGDGTTQTITTEILYQLFLNSKQK